MARKDKTPRSVLLYTDSKGLPGKLNAVFSPRGETVSARSWAKIETVDRDIGTFAAAVIDLGRNRPSDAEISELCKRVHDHDRLVLAVGDPADIAFYRHAKQLGCDEYFTIKNELPLVADHIQGHPSSACTILVHAVKSGIGGSLISAALAQLFSEDMSVGVVDLNWVRPAVNYWLGIDKTGQLHMLAGKGAAIDSLLAAQIKLSSRANLDYYGGYDVTGERQFDVTESQAWFSAVDASTSCTIWKSDRGNACCSNYVLSRADHVVVVCDLGLPSLRSVGDFLNRCHEADKPTIIVINDPYIEPEINGRKIQVFDGPGQGPGRCPERLGDCHSPDEGA